jgi:aminoglycoside 3-N-acetyltransferase I
MRGPLTARGGGGEEMLAKAPRSLGSWHSELDCPMMTSFDYAYRQLTCVDVPLLRELLGVFAEAFDEVDTYKCHVPSDDYLTRLLSKQHFIAVVALKGEEVVGGVASYELDKFEQDRREIYIYDLAVAQGHRRRGVATGMIGELRRIASERNVYVMFVQADPWDGPAIALYESLGTKETAHHFDIEVCATAPQHRGTGR